MSRFPGPGPDSSGPEDRRPVDAGGRGALDSPVMFEEIRRTLSELADALGGDRSLTRDEIDRVLAGMREELVEARARLRQRDDEVADYERRLEALEERGDVDDARLAGLRREVARRRADVEEERDVVEELSERFREAVRRRDVLLAKDRRSRASETVRDAGEEEVRDFERLEERIEEGAHRVEADREVEEALDGPPGSEREGEELEETFRDARAEEQLRELKRRMGMEPDEGE